jgi:hypothetical protein
VVDRAEDDRLELREQRPLQRFVIQKSILSLTLRHPKPSFGRWLNVAAVMEERAQLHHLFKLETQLYRYLQLGHSYQVHSSLKRVNWHHILGFGSGVRVSVS